MILMAYYIFFKSYQGACVLPALRQLINISKNIIKQSFQKADKVRKTYSLFVMVSICVACFFFFKLGITVITLQISQQ